LNYREIGWRVEEACLNAWPASRQLVIDGWLLRASGGPIRRTNSVNPLQRGPHDPTPVLADCEAAYAALGQDALFRVPDIAEGMDAALEARGYISEGSTLTLFAALCIGSPRASSRVELLDAPDAAWVALRTTVNGESEAAARVFHRMTDLIGLPKAFAVLQAEAQIAAVAYGVVDRGLLVVESVATHDAWRGKGFASEVVSVLMRWGADRGASGACLQVGAANAPAMAVYRRLGFTINLHAYHYRRKPG
jgi:GNAT superfamily N-acetyltransferase